MPPINVRPPSPTAASSSAAAAYGVSAGLDLLSGVFGYLASVEAVSAANSRADLMRTEAEANAQRYAEKAAQFEAHEKVMYLSSGVKLSGSPIDVLATTARLAAENIDAIKAAGEREATDQEQRGMEKASEGRNVLIGGIAGAWREGIRANEASQGVAPTGLNALTDYLGMRA